QHPRAFPREPQRDPPPDPPPPPRDHPPLGLKQKPSHLISYRRHLAGAILTLSALHHSALAVPQGFPLRCSSLIPHHSSLSFHLPASIPVAASRSMSATSNPSFPYGW